MDNKQITIIAVCGMLMLLTLVFACSKGCSKKTERKIITKPNTYVPPTVKKEEEEEYHQPSYSYSSGFSSSSGDAPAVLTDEDKAELVKKYDENKKILDKLKKEWMEEKLKDPNVSPVAKEQYKLRSNPNFIMGMQAMENNDFKTAITNFSQILKDKETSPISKYFACDTLMDIAMRIKDPELYFIAARAKGKLEATEDLTMLGVEKKNMSTLDWCDKVEKLLKARNDPKYFDMCVKERLANQKEPIPKEVLARAKKQVEKEIKGYSRRFKELIE